MRIFNNIVFILLLIFICQLSWAEKTKAQADKQKLSELQLEIKQLQKNLNKIQKTKTSELSLLKKTDLNINQLVRQIFLLNEKIIDLEKQYKQLNQSIQSNQQQLQHHQKILSGQIAASYHVGQQEFFKLLLNQQQPAVFSRVMSYYQYFHQARVEQIELISSVIEKLDQQRRELHLLQQEIELQQYLKNTEKASLEDEQKKRNSLIFNLSSEQQNTTEKIKQLEKDEKDLKKLLDILQQQAKKKAQAKKLEEARKKKEAKEKEETKRKAIARKKSRKAFSKLKGRLKWPLKGRLKKLYGRWRSVNKVKWKGNIIDSPEGNNVYSISHGTVVYSDWLRGYGLLTIIDHGKGYMSLYGSSQALLKSVGDEVEKGEVIATAGRTSGRRKAGIYFEIRYNGKATNPKRWCKKMPM